MPKQSTGRVSWCSVLFDRDLGKRAALARKTGPPAEAGTAAVLRMLFGLALAAGLAGCTAAALAVEQPRNEAPPNLRSIIAANLQRPDPGLGEPDLDSGPYPREVLIFGAKHRVTDVQLSDAARRTLTMANGWAWQTCLRATVDGKPSSVAVFVAQNRVIQVRTALIVDRCEEGIYTPLPVKRPVPPPDKKAKKPKTGNQSEKSI